MRLLFVAALAVALLSIEVAGAASSAFPTFLTEGRPFRLERYRLQPLGTLRSRAVRPSE